MLGTHRFRRLDFINDQSWEKHGIARLQILEKTRHEGNTATVGIKLLVADQPKALRRKQPSTST